jgi:hypothetical protein
VQFAFFVPLVRRKITKNHAEERITCWIETCREISFLFGDLIYPWIGLSIHRGISGCMDIWV